MDLVDDDKPNLVDIAALPTLSADYVPLLRRRHNDVRLFDLFTVEMAVARQFPNLNAVGPKPILEVANDLGYQRLHWGDVDHLELTQVEGVTGFLACLTQQLQTAKESDICLSCASWRANEQIVWRSKGCWIDLGLNTVESLHVRREGLLSPFWER